MNFDSLESFLSRFCHTYHSYVDLSSFPVFLSTRAIAHVMLDVESYRFCCWLVVATARSGRMMIMDSDTLREARKHLGLSQMEAAELLEVSLVTYQRWEQGKARPQPFHLRQIRLKFRPGLQALGLMETEPGDRGDCTLHQEEETTCASVVSPLLLPNMPS